MSRNKQDKNEETFQSTDDPEDYTDDANDKNDWEQIKKRNQEYTKFLTRYYTYIETVLEFKEEKRKWIFYISLGILGTPLVALAIAVCFLSKNDFNSINNLIAFITALTTLVSSMIVIPKQIGEYLFNNDDTSQMVDIIKNIQEYDKNVRTDIRERRKKL